MQSQLCPSCKFQSLKTAVCEGRIESVRNIISSYGPCYSQEWEDASDGFVLLRTAVQKKHTEIAKLLLRSGVKVNSRHESPCNTPLHFAVLNGDIEFVHMLLHRGANVNAKNMHDITPLHNAVESMKTEIINMLLNQGANVNAADESSITPLHLAIKNNSKHITTFLLSKGANVNGKGNNSCGCIAANTGKGCTPLYLAVEKGNEELTKLLLSSGANVDAKVTNGKTALHLATQHGYLKIIEHLLTYEADVNSMYTSATWDSCTPLHLATVSGHIEIVKLLLSRGADVDAKVTNGKTALHLAVQHGYLKIVEHLLTYDADVNSMYTSATWNSCTPLHLAAISGHKEIVKLLLSRGADVNAKGKCGKTALHLATQHGYLKIVEHLLTYEADVNSAYTSANRHGYTPLHLAVENDHNEIMKLLLSRGADVNAKGKCGKTSLHLAVQHGYLKIVEHLLTYDADVNSMYTSATWDSCTPLYLATENGHKEVVKLLLTRGADANARGRCKGLTALSCAIERCDVEIVEQLLKYGANQHTTIECDLSPLMCEAAEFGQITIAELLLEFGAEVDFTDIDGATPFFYACQGGHEQLVTAFLEHGADMTIESNYNMLHVALDGIKAFCDRDHCWPEYYHCNSHDISAYVNIADILKRHMIKMKVANLCAVNEYVSSISSDDEEESYFPNESDKQVARVYYSKKVRKERRLARNDFQNECEIEIASIKSEKVGNADITFYDILTKDIHQLTIYARNENVVEAIRSDDYRKKLPIYASIINSNFRKGEKRKEFLEQAEKKFHFLIYNNFPQFSRSCTEKIYFYLNDKDLTALMDACKPIVYCQQS